MTPEAYQERFAADPLYFAESCLKISPKSGGLVNFQLNDEQLAVFKMLWDLWKSGQPVRIIVLKARRLGISTLIESFLYWMVSTKPHTNAMVISHDLDSAHAILQMAHRFADHDGRIKLGIMPKKAKSNRSEIVFDNPVWQERGEHPGLDSRMMVATADSKTAGRSMTLQAAHLSEVSFWPRASLIAGVLEALSSKPETIGVLESTANGRSGYFYETWNQNWRAHERGHQTVWTPIFLSWRGSPDCRVKLTAQQREKWQKQLTDEEQVYGAAHGLDLEQLVWRRQKIQSYEGSGMPAELLFQQEYPLTPEDAFVSTGRQYFDMRTVEQMNTAAKDVPYKDGWIELKQPIIKNRPAGVEFHERKPLQARRSLVRVWRPPVPGCDYVIGADVAMGISGADKSVAYAMRRDTLEFCARISGQIEPDEFADLIVELGWYYNEAFLCPENNSIGMAVAKKTSSKYVRHAYQVDVSKMPPVFDLSKPGWNTHAANRREMFGYLRQLIKDKTIHVWDEDFLSECNDFVVPEDKDGKLKEATPRAIQHKHDDHVAAVAITLQANDPMMAGPIRKPKAGEVVEEDWKRRMVAKDEGPRKVGPVVDETVGSV